MSDRVVQSDHDGDRMAGQSMHFCQSAWMAHWMHTSHKHENQGHDSLSLQYEYKADDGGTKQHGPEIQSDISKSAKGFGEVSEPMAVNIMNENMKLSSIRLGKERLESQLCPTFNLSQNRESIMALKNSTSCQGVVSEMGTSSGESRFQPEGISGNLEEQPRESLEKKSLAVSTSFQNDVGSSSKIVAYRYNNGKSPMHSFICRQEEINQPSPAAASEEHFTNTNFQSYCTSLVHEKKTNSPFDLIRSGSSSLRHDNVPLLLHDPATINNQLPIFVGKRYDRVQNHSGTKLFPNWSSPLDANKSDTSFHDFYSVPRIPRSLHDVESMKKCTTVYLMEGLAGGPPKFSQTTRHFLISEKSDVNLSEGGEILRDSPFSANIKGKMLSKFLSLSPGFGFHCQQGVKLKCLGSSTDSEEKEKFGNVKTSAVCFKNESSAETDTMDMDVFAKNHFAGVVSSPTDEIVRGGQISTTSQAAIASCGEEIGGRLPNTELPDINQELPALPSVATSEDDRETSTSRTQSLDVEHLLSHSELPPNSKSSAFPDDHAGSEPNSRWVKRLKFNASGSFAHGTKAYKMEEASHEKVKKFVSKIIRCGVTSSEPKMGERPGKEPMALDQTAMLLRNVESSSCESVRKTEDVTLLNPWIQRWCHHKTASPKQNHEKVVVCEPRSSNATLDGLQKKQFPSIAAMALMGKSLNSFQPCEFRKRGSYIIWTT